jgi:tetratricopeptide (TPR) repeat protein
VTDPEPAGGTEARPDATPPDDLVTPGLQELLQGDDEAFAATLEGLVGSNADAASALAMVALGVIESDERRDSVLNALADHPVALSWTMQAAIFLEKGVQAREWIEGLTARRPDDEAVQELVAEVAFATGDPTAAAAAADRLVATWPASKSGHWIRANARRQLGDLPGAEEDFTALIGMDPAMADAWTGRGVLREIQGRYEEALADYEEALKLAPSASAWRNVADAHLGLGRVEEAEAGYTRAIELDADYLEAYLGRARARTASNRYPEAIADLDHVLEVDPDHPAALAQRALIRALMGTDALPKGDREEGRRQYALALADYDRVLTASPDAADVLLQRGMVHAVLAEQAVIESGRGSGDEEYRKAVADYDQVVRLAPDAIPALLNRANARQQLGDLAGAEEDFTAVIGLDPTTADAWTGRGVLREVQGRYAEALADYEEALQLAPTAPAWRNKADAQLSLGEFTEAEAGYTRAIELDPDYVEAYLGRARARTASNRYPEAIADLDHVLEANPDHPALAQRALVRALMGTAALTQGDREEGLRQYALAIEDYDGALTAHPKIADAWLQRGLVHAVLAEQAVAESGRGAGDDEYRKAVADYDQATALAPDAVQPILNRAQARQQLGEMAEAEADFTTVVGLDPGSAEAWTGRGILREIQGRYEEALADYDAALKLAPSAQAWRNRADANLGLGRLADAESDYTKAIELDGAFVEAYVGRARARTVDERYADALADLDHVLEGQPDHPARAQRALVHATMGTTALSTGDREEARRQFGLSIEDYDRALAVHPELSDAWLQRGLVHEVLAEQAVAESGRGAGDDEYRAAVADFDQAVQLAPSNVAPLLNRAQARQQLGDRAEAEADFTAVLALDPGSADAWTGRGILREVAGRYDEALADYEQALKLAPSAQAWRNRADVHLALGHLEQAEADYSEAIGLDAQLIDAYVGRAKARSGQSDQQLAIRDYDTAIELDPDRASLYLNRADILAAQNDLDLAGWDADRAIELEPENGEAWRTRAFVRIRLADNYRSNRLYDQQIQTLRGGIDDADAAVRLLPDDPWSARYRGYALRGIGAYDEADPAFAAAAELEQTTPVAHASAVGDRAENLRLWGVSLEARERLDQALEIVSAALEDTPIDPTLYWAYQIHADTLLALDRPAEAAEAARRAIDCDASVAWAAVTLGKAQLKTEDREGAVRTFRETAAMTGAGPAEVLLARVGLALALRDSSPDESAAALAQALDRETPQAYLDRADTLLDFGARDEAEHDYRSALELDPGAREAMNSLAWSYVSRDRSERKLPEAIELGHRAVDGLPESPTRAIYLDTLGWACHLAGRDDDAVTFLRECVQIEPKPLVHRFHLKAAERVPAPAPAN